MVLMLGLKNPLPTMRKVSAAKKATSPGTAMRKCPIIIRKPPSTTARRCPR
jgi:hypothetical protein